MKNSIRASMLPGWNDCPRRAAAKQFRKEIMDAGYSIRTTLPSVGAAIGTAVHAGLQRLFELKINGGIPEKNDAADVAITKFEDEAGNGLEWDDTTQSLRVAHIQIARMCAASREVAKRIQPCLVEEALKAEAPNGYELTGHVDVFGMDGIVTDFKTGALERPYQAQLGGYALLIEERGFQVNGVQIAFLRRTPSSKSQDAVHWSTQNLEISKMAAWATIQDIIRTWDQFSVSHDPWVINANPMSMMCRAQFCLAHSTEFCKMGC